MERRKKTNRMLIGVSLLFFLSWAPINMFNIVLDNFEPFGVCQYCHETSKPPNLLIPGHQLRHQSDADHLCWLPSLCHDFCPLQPHHVRIPQ